MLANHPKGVACSSSVSTRSQQHKNVWTCCSCSFPKHSPTSSTSASAFFSPSCLPSTNSTSSNTRRRMSGKLLGGKLICHAKLALDRELETPAPGFSSIQDALEDLAAGKFLVVLDDEDRENEGDLVIAADKVTPEAMAYMVEYTSGVVCIAMEGTDLDRLRLPLMVSSAENEEAMYTAFAVTVDLKEGITTGISASDRARTIRRLADPTANASHFRRPGHIFPLRYRSGGTLVRPGHTEASVDLARLAGCHPSGVLCEIVDKATGEMARTPVLREYAAAHGLKCITIADLIRYRLRHEQLVEHLGSTPVASRHGPITLHSFRSALDGSEHLALVVGSISSDSAGSDSANNGSTGASLQGPVHVCVHHEQHGVDLLTGITAAVSGTPSSESASSSSNGSVVRGASSPSCSGSSLDGALCTVAARGGGVVLYMRSRSGDVQDVDGRSSSSSSSILTQCRALHQQQQASESNGAGPAGNGADRNGMLDTTFDLKAYGLAAQMLRALGVREVALLSDDVRQQQALRSCGVEISSTQPRVQVQQHLKQQQHAVTLG